MRPEARDCASVASFVRKHAKAVVATVSLDGWPEAALVGMAALDDGTLIFDTERTARKVDNLRGQRRVAVVVGTEGEISVQIEGPAVITDGVERTRFGAAYDAQFPGSRALEPDFAVIVVRPDWVRVYDSSVQPPHVTEAHWNP